MFIKCNNININLTKMNCIICIVFAFILILKGGDLLVESAIWLAKKAQIPSLIVGSTIVAIATTFPEVSVAIFSGIQGTESLAINTALGSMVCNFALVLGLSFLFLPSCVSKNGLVKKFIYFVFSLFVLFIISLDQELGILDAVVLLCVFTLFIISNFKDARKNCGPELELVAELPSWKKTIFQFFVSAMSIGFGASVLVSNIDNLSSIMGVNEGLLGVFVIAVGTNIPELVTTLTAIKLKDSSIGIGNIFGASIIDATMLIAVTVISGQNKLINMPIKLMVLTIVSLVVITFLIILPIMKNGKSNRVQGGLLLILFIVYSIILAKIS